MKARRSPRILRAEYNGIFQWESRRPECSGKDCTQKASNENTEYACISYFPVAAINYPDQKQLRGEECYFSLQFQRGYSPIQSVHDREGMVSGVKAILAINKQISFYPYTGNREKRGWGQWHTSSPQGSITFQTASQNVDQGFKHMSLQRTLFIQTTILPNWTKDICTIFLQRLCLFFGRVLKFWWNPKSKPRC